MTIERYRVNYVNNLYWHYQSVFTFSRKHWGPKVFKSFEELDKILPPEKYAIIVDLNKDLNLIHYNLAQQVRMKILYFQKEIIKKFDDKNFIHKVSWDNKINIYFDNNSYKSIKKGFIPFCNKFYFMMLIESKIANIVWRKSGFNEYSPIKKSS